MTATRAASTPAPRPTAAPSPLNPMACRNRATAASTPVFVASNSRPYARTGASTIAAGTSDPATEIRHDQRLSESTRVAAGRK